VAQQLDGTPMEGIARHAEGSVLGLEKIGQHGEENAL